MMEAPLRKNADDGMLVRRLGPAVVKRRWQLGACAWLRGHHGPGVQRTVRHEVAGCEWAIQEEVRLVLKG